MIYKKQGTDNSGKTFGRHNSRQHKNSNNHKSADGHSRSRHHKASHGENRETSDKSKDLGKTGNEEARMLAKIPPLQKGVIRVIPLGGVEEVGRNMLVFEYGDDIIVSDVGFQFESEDDAPGIDYILPNTKYLEERKEKIRAVVITHGHLDHIGAIPYLIPRLGNPTIYTQGMTALMIKKRQEEFPDLPELNIKIISLTDKIKFKDVLLRFFKVTHSIPDSMGIVIETPHGNIVTSGDFKLDHINGEPTDQEKETYGNLGKENNILFIADSTNVENSGYSITERQIHENFENIIKNVKGRLIVGTFASQFERMIKIIQIAEKYGKKIVTEGRGIKTNIDIAIAAGILKPLKGTLINAEDMETYPKDRIIILATGAQGEEFAALMRMANKKHKYIHLDRFDTVVLSSSIIPGNETSVRKLKDNLYRHNVSILHYKVSDVHSTGHGNAGELAWINSQVGAKFFMPAYGFHSMLKVHAQVARGIGMKDENIIVPDNGTIIEIKEGKTLNILKEKAPSAPFMVDGFSIGSVQDVVIKDRQVLSQDGMFVIVASINPKTGKLKKSPDIISRGFVYLRESQELLQKTRALIKNTIEESVSGMNPIDFDFVRNSVANNVRRFLLRETGKKPVVIPVILGLS
ncbi:MAG: ribonuclease J [Patescibacteria group bacterium]